MASPKQKSQTRTMYLHTFDGAPATYEPKPSPALIVIQQPSRLYPEAAGVLVRSVRTIRAHERRCLMASPHLDSQRFGFVRVEVPRG